MDNQELLKLANQAKERAYAPYSEFKVGAAVLTTSGKVYTGCNVENVSYGASVCAERVAMFKAISEGETEFEKLAIMSSSGDITFPCGMCRQVMSEFMSKGEVVLGDKFGGIRTYKLAELLPYAFENWK